jgi:hypothetical protein
MTHRLSLQREPFPACSGNKWAELSLGLEIAPLFAAVTSCEQPTAFIEAERVNA